MGKRNRNKLVASIKFHYTSSWERSFLCSMFHSQNSQEFDDWQIILVTSTFLTFVFLKYYWVLWVLYMKKKKRRSISSVASNRVARGEKVLIYWFCKFDIYLRTCEWKSKNWITLEKVTVATECKWDRCISLKFWKKKVLDFVQKGQYLKLVDLAPIHLLHLHLTCRANLLFFVWIIYLFRNSQLSGTVEV